MSAPARSTRPAQPGGPTLLGAADAAVLLAQRSPGRWEAERLGAWALWCLAACCAVVSLGWPLGFDHGIYAWTADVVRSGGMVYRDAWDMHGPLVAYLYAVPLELSGGAFWSVRVLDLCFTALGAAAYRHVLRHAVPGLGGSRLSWLTALFVLSYLAHDFNNTAQPDVWVAMVALAVLAAGTGRRAPTLAFVVLAGLMAGCLALVKPFFGLFVLPPLVLHAAAEPRDWRRSASAVVVAALASLVPISLTAAWFASHGALADLVEVHLRYPALAYNDGFPLEIGERLTQFYLYATRGKLAPIGLPLAAVGALVLWRARRRAPVVALLASLGLGLALAVFQHKYYVYHWMSALPAMLTLAAAAVAVALAAPRGSLARSVGIVGVGTLVLHAAVRPAYWSARGLLYHTGVRPSATAYFGGFEDDRRSTPLERMQLGTYLRDQLGPDRTVAIWGTEAGTLHLANASTPFRLAGWSFPLWDAAGGPLHAGYVTEYIGALRTQTPAYYVVNLRTASARSTDNATWRAMAIQQQPAILQLLAERFVDDTLIGPFRVLRRR